MAEHMKTDDSVLTVTPQVAARHLQTLANAMRAGDDDHFDEEAIEWAEFLAEKLGAVPIHVPVLHGLCPICHHSGEDCTAWEGIEFPGTTVGLAQWHALNAKTCRHCGRSIVNVDGTWVDPQATGDDSVWRETCDAHDTFVAEHEPAGDDPVPVVYDTDPETMTKTRQHEYKIVHNRDIGENQSQTVNAGGWQVKVRQYPDGVTGMWFDAGDPCDTRGEAETKLAEFMAADKGLRQRDDGRWEPNDG